MNGSTDTSRSGDAPAALDDLPPGIAWLLGPGRPLPAPQAPAAPEPPVPAQVVTWLPDGRWVTDADGLAPEVDAQSDPSTGRRRRSGRSEVEDRPGRGLERDRPASPGGLRRRRSGSVESEPGLPSPLPGVERGQRRSGSEPGLLPSPLPGVERGQRRSGSEPGLLPSPLPGVERGQRRSGGDGREPGERRPEAVERSRRWGRRRVRLARVGARLAGWPRRVVIGVLLVMAAVLALRPEAARPPAAAVGPSQHVVVAARDLAAGTELAATDLRIVSMPVGIVPSGSSPRAAGLIGRIAAGAIRRGEALTDARVVGPGLAAGLGADEAAAVPVRIADPDAVALVRVGDRVDVLGTPVAPDGTQATAGETVTVATAVRVLAVLRSRDPSDGVVLVVATGEAAAHTLAGAAARHRLTVNVRPP